METQDRCPWAGPDEIYKDYHDNEWGRPTHDDRRLFELLSLEGMQAGLSWLTILKKRPAFRRAFDGFDPRKVAGYGGEKVEQLMADPSIVRNRRKILSVIENAKRVLDIQREHGSFDRFLWQYVDGVPVVNSPASQAEVPASSPLSDRLSADLKRRGFTFVGPTIIYSFLQAAGLVDDHLTCCGWHSRVRQQRDWVRTASIDDLDAVSAVEAQCFPLAEAATREEFRQRLLHYGGHFWLLFRGGRLIAFVDGMVTDRPGLTDEMYQRAELHDENGAWQMIFGVNTVPDCRKQGCAGLLLRRAIADARAQGRRGLVLTCKDTLVHYYASFGFVNEGVSPSVHGNVVWNQMRLTF